VRKTLFVEDVLLSSFAGSETGASIPPNFDLYKFIFKRLKAATTLRLFLALKKLYNLFKILPFRVTLALFCASLFHAPCNLCLHASDNRANM
jgi:hypothetical protein